MRLIVLEPEENDHDYLAENTPPKSRCRGACCFSRSLLTRCRLLLFDQRLQHFGNKLLLGSEHQTNLFHLSLQHAFKGSESLKAPGILSMLSYFGDNSND